MISRRRPSRCAAEAAGTGRQLRAWLAGVGLVLRPVAGPAGRDRQASERLVSLGMDGVRLVLPAQRQRALIVAGRSDASAQYFLT
jgi:hypothetical protein